jgi:hypothetical protein
MDLKHRSLGSALLLGAVAVALLTTPARAATCKTQSQMTAAERDALANIAHILASEVQTGDTPALQAHTLPAVAADFAGISASAEALKPLMQQATITVESLYFLDASQEPAGSPRTDFFCGSPVVVMNFTGLPPGIYGLAIVHATGVPKPQQISLVLGQGADQHWMLGGFSARPLTEAGHDGLWYWVSARKFAQQNMNWDAWFYYKTAAYYLVPNDFLSSPNLEKLQREQEAVKPTNLPAPGAAPLVLNANGSSYQVTGIDTTSELGGFDLEVQYSPDPTQVTQLRNPPVARKQVTDVMLALLGLHPELQSAFHGIWVHANQGNDSLFSLELPMDQIMPGSLTPPLPASAAKP